MASFTPGYTFAAGEQITPAKLNTLINSASLTGLSPSNFAGSVFKALIYGNAAPPLARGTFWFDTTVNAPIGLKYAFVSASNSSVNGWLYLTPRREMYCWCNTAVTMGSPLYVYDSYGAYNEGWVAYDGNIFLKVFPKSNQSGVTPAIVHAMEAAAASGPVKCAWAGILTCYDLTAVSANPTIGQPLFLRQTEPGTYYPGDTYKSVARQYCTGLVGENNANLNFAGIVWGGGTAYQYGGE